MAPDILATLKTVLREEAAPYFTDSELVFYYNKNKGDLNSTLYECFTVKADDTTLSISGLSLGDTSKYFRRLAQQYRPRNTGILKG